MANKKWLIDVNVAIERAKESDKIVGSSVWETCEVVEFLEDCPIEDAVEVKHGRMVEVTPDAECPWYKVWECSLCGNRGDVWYNYCPNCGADMRERKDNG